MKDSRRNSRQGRLPSSVRRPLPKVPLMRAWATGRRAASNRQPPMSTRNSPKDQGKPKRSTRCPASGPEAPQPTAPPETDSSVALPAFAEQLHHRTVHEGHDRRLTQGQQGDDGDQWHVGLRHRQRRDGSHGSGDGQHEGQSVALGDIGGGTPEGGTQQDQPGGQTGEQADLTTRQSQTLIVQYKKGEQSRRRRVVEEVEGTGLTDRPEEGVFHPLTKVVRRSVFHTRRHSSAHRRRQSHGAAGHLLR